MTWLLVGLAVPLFVLFQRDAWVWTGFAGLWAASGGVFAAKAIRASTKFRFCWLDAAPLAMAVAGGTQLLTGRTVLPEATQGETLLWVAFTGLFIAARTLFARIGWREQFLDAALIFGTLIALLSLVQFYTSNGLIYWLIPSGQEQVWGPFRNRNHMAAFLELIFPLAATRIVKNPRRRFEFVILSGILAAPVLLGGSRAGIALIAAQSALIFLAGRWRVWAAVAALAGLLLLTPQFVDRDSGHRPEMNLSAMAMIQARPLTGFGLGTFETVYPAYALFDNSLTVDHAHNDWLEWASEAGVPAVLPLIATAIWAGIRAFRHPWALGIPAIFLHSLVDYPLHKPALTAWTLVLLAALAAAVSGKVRRSARAEVFRTNPQPDGRG